MYGEEHYLSKIERNYNCLDKAPEHARDNCYKNIVWARELSGRLDNLDYEQREEAIDKLHKILDNDYKLMGFELEKSAEKTI